MLGCKTLDARASWFQAIDLAIADYDERIEQFRQEICGDSTASSQPPKPAPRRHIDQIKKQAQEVGLQQGTLLRSF
jgi:shikimate 5-dehydrogenase